MINLDNLSPFDDHRIRQKQKIMATASFKAFNSVAVRLLGELTRIFPEDMCIRVVLNPIRSEPQEHNRFRFWSAVPELGGRCLRVVTLDDRLTIHNAFPDRRFRP